MTDTQPPTPACPEQEGEEKTNRPKWKKGVFYVRDGWYFRQEEDGGVRVHYGERDKVGITLTPDEWASVVFHMGE